MIGSPLDPDSYDYAGQVLFNACAGALWSRFALEVRRALAERGGIPGPASGEHVAVSFAKVAEFQGAAWCTSTPWSGSTARMVPARRPVVGDDDACSMR